MSNKSDHNVPAILEATGRIASEAVDALTPLGVEVDVFSVLNRTDHESVLEHRSLWTLDDFRKQHALR